MTDNELEVPETAPAKFTLTVINHTDQDMKWEQSWEMTSPTSGVVKAGDTVKLSSNEVQSDHINVYPLPPKGVDQPNPGSGTFSMQYGYDGYQKIARVYCCNACSKGRPTKTVQDTLTNWYYVDTYKVDPCVQTNTTNTVIFTVVEQPIK